ncbi:MAG: heme exporter protein CcmD, partial [Acetobacter cibinongensis]
TPPGRHRMTHLPYILASYGLFAGLAIALTVNATLRLKTARARLALLERPSSRPPGASSSP